MGMIGHQVAELSGMLEAPRELIPGEPHDVDQLAAATRDFAVTAADGANAVGALTLGGWVGAAATVFAAELGEAPRRLQVAVDAFAQASTALRRHAVVLSDAQLVAAVAFQMWAEAEAASQMWRGVTIGPDTLPPSDTDPGLDGMARAAAMPARAREDLSWTVEGKLATRILPDGTSERWDHDGEGNLRTHTDPLGQTTTLEYTSFDLPAARTGPDGARTTYTHDTELRLIAVTDPAGLVWSYQRDAVGNVVAETDVNGRHLRYAYDPARQLVESVNGVGQTTHITRDALGNITERHSPDAVTTFAYDPVGRLAGATNPDATLTFERDALGRVTAETCNGATLTSTYDALGRRTHRRTPSGAKSHWDYGPGPAPLALHTAGTTLTFAYDPAGRQIEQLVGNHTAITKTWDANHRLLTQSVTGGPPRAYRYRPDGNLIGIDDPAGTRTFDLDPAGRVLTARGPEGVEEYTYDLSGNVISHAAAAHDWEQVGTLVRRTGLDRYEHDAGGRTILRQRKRLSAGPATWRYTWDADDRLIAVTTPDGTRWRYSYDPLGRRIAKRRLAADGNGVTETTHFTWDGPVLAEQSATGTESDVRRTTTWDYEHDSFRPLGQTIRTEAAQSRQQRVDAEFFAIVTDLVGAPTEVVDPAGTIAPLPHSALWGASIDAPPVDQTCALRFPGQYYDAETALHYNHHRYYNPDSSRYLSPDPLGLAASSNPNTYVPSPTSWADPLGLMNCTATNEVGPGWFPYGTNKIPSGWLGPEMTRKFRTDPAKEGFVWRAQKGQDSVRIDRGNPDSSFNSQQTDHVVINFAGRIIARDGAALPPGARIQNIPDQAHIPLSEWQTWRSWNAP